MINLLSPQKKQYIRGILFSRFLDGVFLAVVVSLALLIILLVPIYFYLERQAQDVETLNNALSQNERFNQIKIAGDVIASTNEKLKIFPDSLPENGYIESVLNKIINLKGPQIKIKSFRYTNPNKADAKSTNIEISGTALNRASLLDFKQRLESEKSFANIVLPISSFVKVDNIEFSIRLKSN